MKNKYDFLILLFLVFFICSCDPKTEFYRTIRNESSKELKLLFFARSSTTAFDSTIIQLNNEHRISEGGRLGGDPNTCGSPIDSLTLSVVGDNSLKVMSDLNSQDTYAHSKTGNDNKGYHVECRAVIKDSDIEQE